MDVLLDDDERAIRDQARAFLEAASTPALVRACEKDGKVSADLWKQVVELGWLETSLPEDIDGLGLGLGNLGLLFEEVGRYIAPIPFLSTMVPLLVLAKHGGERHAAAISAVRHGQSILSFAIQEPTGGWLVDEIKLHGKVEGGEVVLTGTKMFVDNFAVSDKCLVAFRGAEGLSLALVDTKAQNLDQVELVSTAKDAESRVDFRGVRVPCDAIVGELGKAENAIRELMDLSALFHACQLVGAGRRAIEMAIEYSKQRYTFEQPLGSFQAIQHTVADVINGVDGAELLSREAAWKISEGKSSAAEVSQAKAFASEKCLIAARSAQQIHGGVGFMMEFDLQLWYRRVVSWSLRSGTVIEHRRRIAQFLFDGRNERIRLDLQPAL